MLLNRAIVLGLLMVTGSSWAESGPGAVDQPQPRAGAAQPDVPVDVQPGLAPRAPLPKVPAAQLRMNQSDTGRLIIKFNDNMKARVNNGALASMTARDVTSAERIIRQFGLTVEPAIRLQTDQVASIESRAAARSGKAQPDLGGMMYLTAPPGSNGAVIEAAAQALHTLPEVEFVQFEPKYVLPRGGGGACCIGTLCSPAADANECTAMGGAYQGDGTDCSTPFICSGGAPTGRCCIPSVGTVSCVDNFSEAQCLAQFGRFGGAGSTCAGLPGGLCPDYGACCVGQGCQTLLASECIAGKFIGVGINCGSPGICEPVGDIGRCCVPNEMGGVDCVDDLDEDTCDATGGLFGGAGTDCADIAGNCPLIGACCSGNNDCEPLTEAQCDALLDTTFLGVGTNCITDGACDAPDCGVPGTGPCNECHDPSDPFSAGLFCDNEDCCTTVCAIDPFCCEEDASNLPPHTPFTPPHWDSICVYLAATECQPPLPPPPPACPSTGSCFAGHANNGCNDTGCCIAICNIEPFCCSTEWDAICADLASQYCPDNNPASSTPSFTDAQGYLTPLTYFEQFGFIPPNAGGGILLDPCSHNNFKNPFTGYNGLGWEMHSLWQFGAALANQQGPGTVNRARGKGIKVGVIEHSAFADWQNPALTHEDLRGKVIPEPGQTVIINPLNPFGDQGGNHGTATLGIVGAKDEGTPGHSLQAVGFTDAQGNLHVSDEVGVVGIAPDADLYFFPIVSLEEGGRLLGAIGKALTIFGPGDVLSFSIGPTDVCNTTATTLVSNPAEWTIVRLASDLGVTCCVAAGNACCDVDPSAQFAGMESGAIIVGAIEPGFPYCRLGFSNYCENCDGANLVHVSAWGTSVTTLGYGDLFFGNDPANSSGRRVRSYTNTFGGTSAATPQIAGLVACMQGLAKQIFEIPMNPAQVRGILTLNGWPQCGIDDVDDIPGPLDNPCAGDFDPEEDAARVGGPANFSAYPILVSASPFGSVRNIVDALVQLGMGGGNSIVDGICILRGQLVQGAAASILARDNNYLVVRSQFTTRGDRPSANNCAQFVNQIASGFYVGNGDVMDVMVHATNEVEGANRVTVNTKIGYPGMTSFQIVQLWDWVSNRWAGIGSVFLDGVSAVCEDSIGGPEHCLSFVAAQGGSRYIQSGTGRVLARVYVIGLTANTDLTGIGDGHYNGRIDQIQVITDAVSGGGINPTGTGNTGGGGVGTP
jgi:hypothetical protein